MDSQRENEIIEKKFDELNLRGFDFSNGYKYSVVQKYIKKKSLINKNV